MRVSLGADKTSYVVSVDDVRVSESYFARRYGRRLPIVNTLSISLDGHFSCVTEPASEKGEGPSKTKYFRQSRTFFLAEILHIPRNRRKPSCKGTMYREIGKTQLQRDPF